MEISREVREEPGYKGDFAGGGNVVEHEEITAVASEFEILALLCKNLEMK